MKSTRLGLLPALVGALVILNAALVAPAYAQSAQKAIVLAWDGIVPTFVR
jgi:hypothetical protein